MEPPEETKVTEKISGEEEKDTVLNASKSESDGEDEEDIKSNVKSGTLTDEGRFQCESCPASYSKKNHLKRHMAVHTGVCFNCPQCGRNFSRMDKMKEHLRNVHHDEEVNGGKEETSVECSCMICLKRASILERERPDRLIKFSKLLIRRRKDFNGPLSVCDNCFENVTSFLSVKSEVLQVEVKVDNLKRELVKQLQTLEKKLKLLSKEAGGIISETGEISKFDEFLPEDPDSKGKLIDNLLMTREELNEMRDELDKKLNTVQKEIRHILPRQTSGSSSRPSRRDKGAGIGPMSPKPEDEIVVKSEIPDDASVAGSEGNKEDDFGGFGEDPDSDFEPVGDKLETVLGVGSDDDYSPGHDLDTRSRAKKRKLPKLNSESSPEPREEESCARRTVSGLKTPRSTKRTGKPFVCEKCPASFLRSNHLRRHMAIHTGLMFDCPHCDKKFTRKDKIKDHIRRFHSDIVPEQGSEGTVNNDLEPVRNSSNTQDGVGMEAQSPGKGDGTPPAKRSRSSSAKPKSKKKSPPSWQFDLSGVSPAKKAVLEHFLSYKSRPLPAESGFFDPRTMFSYSYDSSTSSLHVASVEVRIIEESQTVQCGVCDYSHSTATPKFDTRLMFNHILGKHLSAFDCHQCSSKITTFSRYCHHMRAHQNEFMCPICGRSLSSQQTLREHMWLHKTPEEIEQALNSGEKDPRRKPETDLELPCEICGKIFPSKPCLQQHQKVHNPAREKVQCPNCGKFFWPSGYDCHRKNTCFPPGLEPARAQCTSCPASFKNSRTLWKHVQYAHTEKAIQRGFRCDICGKGYSSHNSLSRHILTHSAERNFVCSYGCGSNYKTRKDSRRHEDRCRLKPQQLL